VQKLFVNREKFIHKEKAFHFGGVEIGVFFLGLKMASKGRNM
jgi:hypothetical protein